MTYKWLGVLLSSGGIVTSIACIINPELADKPVDHKRIEKVWRIVKRIFIIK